MRKKAYGVAIGPFVPYSFITKARYDQVYHPECGFSRPTLSLFAPYSFRSFRPTLSLRKHENKPQRSVQFDGQNIDKP